MKYRIFVMMIVGMNHTLQHRPVVGGSCHALYLVQPHKVFSKGD